MNRIEDEDENNDDGSWVGLRLRLRPGRIEFIRPLPVRIFGSRGRSPHHQYEESQSPFCVLWKDVVEFGAGARLGHHGSDGVAPGLVVPGFFVSGRCVGRAIRFDEHEAGWIVLLLEDVEGRDARFFDTLASVCEGGIFKGFDVFRLQMNLNVNDEHNQR